MISRFRHFTDIKVVSQELSKLIYTTLLQYLYVESLILLPIYCSYQQFLKYNFSADRAIYPFVHPIGFFSPIDMLSEICQFYATLSSFVRSRLALWQLLVFLSALRLKNAPRVQEIKNQRQQTWQGESQHHGSRASSRSEPPTGSVAQNRTSCRRG